MKPIGVQIVKAGGAFACLFLALLFWFLIAMGVDSAFALTGTGNALAYLAVPAFCLSAPAILKALVDHYRMRASSNPSRYGIDTPKLLKLGLEAGLIFSGAPLFLIFFAGLQAGAALFLPSIKLDEASFTVGGLLATLTWALLQSAIIHTINPSEAGKVLKTKEAKLKIV